MSESLATLTKTYISRNAHLKELLRRGLINYSALAREICTQHRVPFSRAAVVAAARYAQRLKGQRSQEQQLRRVLKKAKLTIRGRMMVAGVNRDHDRRRISALHSAIKEAGDDLTVIEGLSTWAITTGSNHKTLLRSIFKERVHTLVDKVAQIVLETGKDAMFTPGLSGYILGRLSGAGINVIEEYTCAGEHLLVVAEADLPAALRALEASS